MIHGIMVAMLVVAFALGVSAGLRSLIAPAVVLLARHDTVAGLIVAVLAGGELVADMLPKTPSRTAPIGLGVRIVSGAFVGALIAPGGATGLRVAGAVAGVAGALVGTFVGHDLRLKAITPIGAIPAALAEDVVAIAIAVFAVLAYGPAT
jgi:uncharacterized membrane protein